MSRGIRTSPTPTTVAACQRAWSISSARTLSLTTSPTPLSIPRPIARVSWLAVHHHYDSNLRRDYLEVLGSPQTVKHQYEYDTASRMSKVYEGTNTHVTYAYHTDSPLIQTVTFRGAGSNGAVVMTRTNNYDYLNRLKDTTSAASNLFSFAYQYNSANQRTRVTREDSSSWSYGYDDLGQVTNGVRYWSDGGAVAGQQFDYAFDHIGNRTKSHSGGDQWGMNRRLSTYAPNQLNQYTTHKVPGSVDIIGTAHASASVTVDTVATQRKSDYFRANVVVNNSAGPAFQTNTVRGVRPDGTNDVMTEDTRTALLPPATQSFTYDDDGNLLNDGVWNYTWDAENRLTQMTNLTTVATDARKKLVFNYDYLGRRVTKKVYPWSGTNYSATAQTDLRFVYDGWNLLGEVDSTNGVTRSYMWGLDSSGTQEGAGGVGGLLALTDNSSSVTRHFACYDGNGNVAALIKSDGSTSAQYEYSPFGETIRLTGNIGTSNPLRFSTKYQDAEGDLAYYGYRYYSTSTGKWLSRDLIGELGGPNTYQFVYNSPIRSVDALGLKEIFEDETFRPSLGILAGRVGTVTIVNGTVVHGTFLNQAERAYINYELTGREVYVDRLADIAENARVVSLNLLAAGLDRPLQTSLNLAGFSSSSIYQPKPAGTVRVYIPAQCCETAPSRNVAGLTVKQATELRQILQSIPGVKEVGVFGSRARGTQGVGSDLDVALFGKVDLRSPEVRQRLLAAQKYAREAGIGCSTKVLDINIWESRLQMQLDFINSPGFDLGRGLPIPRQLE